MSEIEDLLRGLARKLYGCVTDTECARVLRDSGLLRLLEAGQAVRDCPTSHLCKVDWDAAKVELQERVKCR